VELTSRHSLQISLLIPGSLIIDFVREAGLRVNSSFRSALYSSLKLSIEERWGLRSVASCPADTKLYSLTSFH